MRTPAPELRTRPPVPVTIVRPKKRHCTKCGAVLRWGNTRTLCSPCGQGEIELPEWAVVLCELADIVISPLAATLRSDYGFAPEPEPEDLDAPFCKCGCGERTLRLIQSHFGRPSRTGPYQIYRGMHRNRAGVRVVSKEALQPAQTD